MKSKKHVGYENTGKSSDLTVRFCNEMMQLFCYDIGSGFEVCRSDINTVVVRYPLTNTYFIIRFDEGLLCWRIIDGNCKDIVEHTEEFDLSGCVRYIRLHRFGHSMPAYFSYAAS